MLALLHTKNHLAGTLTVDAAATCVLSDLFHQYVTVWHKAEQRRREKDEEQANLYKYKDKVHGDTLTEDERNQKEIEEAFPTFEQVGPRNIFTMYTPFIDANLAPVPCVCSTPSGKAE